MSGNCRHRGAIWYCFRRTDELFKKFRSVVWVMVVYTYFVRWIEWSVAPPKYLGVPLNAHKYTLLQKEFQPLNVTLHPLYRTTFQFSIKLRHATRSGHQNFSMYSKCSIVPDRTFNVFSTYLRFSYDLQVMKLWDEIIFSGRLVQAGHLSVCVEFGISLLFSWQLLPHSSSFLVSQPEECFT